MLPIHLDLTNKQVVIAGGGLVAARRASALCMEPCRITIVSPDICDEMAKLIETNGLNWEKKKVGAEDLKDAFLIVAATNDPLVNEWITQTATPHQLVNCVSQSEFGNVIVPKVVRAGKVTISVSTSGASPSRTKELAAAIESLLEQEDIDALDALYIERKKQQRNSR
ncbi:precorrin-2 dehydrogenase/sirohydrochlorin ferrochelatase family protein [Bacillus xiamenensis]|uniref:precorrin-2 dehydrogenase n=1 Tax=Bacillus xiamenensis TaxID=1178537 RepID=A0ABT4F2N3_9BACI|nr:bifunctional precorrin-2 dehydrogenase/sirohydrochlorin ferrochelatase [Bacillus xiamenensis]EKF37483.1 precorrin-2 dehydrogenase [Bacillus xiamenensis]MBG9912585.1 precorrin-2 dehydrogenase [Bacillus xiamenensis]MCY9574856.1 bifunctional precorrin-2 dehydrogenase/sirohydrochlorin ferrochelatase [Bacillus xiamenensis]